MATPLNYLTARPTLELLLALEGLEAPDLAPDAALPVFAEFLSVAQAAGTIDAGFQAEIVAETAEEGLLSLTLGLRYPLPIHALSPEQPPLYRTVGIRWDLQVEDPGRFEPSVVWVEDYPDLNGFAAAVRGTTEWQEARRAVTWQCTVLAEDD